MDNVKDRQGILKKILPVLGGNLFEYYDFCLYGLLAPIFSKIFFPASFKHSLAASFFLFAIAYVARPVGAIFWGHIGDRYGRKYVLMGTLPMMAVPSIGMAFMPTYASIGMPVCFLIILLRLLQGVAYGGETPAIKVALYELAPNDQKGFFTSFTDASSTIGYLIAICIMIVLNSVLSSEQMMAWGWRFMFGISLVFLFLLGYIRFNLIETLPKAKTTAFPVALAFKKEWKNIFKIVCYLFAITAMFYTFFFHAHILIQAKNSFSESQIYLIQALGMIYCIFLFPLMGYISDIIGRFKMLTFSYVAIIISIFPIYSLLLSGELYMTIVGYLILGFFASILIGTYIAIIVSQVSENCKVTVIGLATSLSLILGSFTPMLNEILIQKLHTHFAPAYYIMLCTIISLITLLFLKDTQQIKRRIECNTMPQLIKTT